MCELLTFVIDRKCAAGVCSGVGLCIEENLYHGRSERCDTFSNPPLNGSQDFAIASLEVYGFVS